MFTSNKKNNDISNNTLSPLILQTFGKKISESPEHIKSPPPSNFSFKCKNEKENIPTSNSNGESISQKEQHYPNNEQTTTNHPISIHEFQEINIPNTNRGKYKLLIPQKPILNKAPKTDRIRSANISFSNLCDKITVTTKTKVKKIKSTEELELEKVKLELEKLKQLKKINNLYLRKHKTNKNMSNLNNSMHVGHFCEIIPKPFKLKTEEKFQNKKKDLSKCYACKNQLLDKSFDFNDNDCFSNKMNYISLKKQGKVTTANNSAIGKKIFNKIHNVSNENIIQVVPVKIIRNPNKKISLKKTKNGKCVNNDENLNVLNYSSFK